MSSILTDSSLSLCNELQNDSLYKDKPSSSQPSIVVTDIADTLVCKHFDFADLSSPSSIRQCRGIIEDIDGNVVCKSFGFTPEFPLKDSQSIQEVVIPFLQRQDVICIPSYEGTLIRVFFYNNKWHITTHKKIDAKQSKWGCDVSFGELFEQAYKHHYQLEEKSDIQLDLEQRFQHENVYIFLLKNYFYNRIVCNATDIPNLILLGHIQKQSSTYQFILHDDTLQLNITTQDQLVEYVEQINITCLQGVILIDPTTLECIKVINNNYWFYYTLRNNQPNVIYRFIELVQQQTPKETFNSFNQRINEKRNETCISLDMIKFFLELYPEYNDMFLKSLHTLDNIATNIYRKYRNRFVRKQITFVPQEQYYVMKELHEQFINSGKKDIVSQQRVIHYLYSQPTSRLYFLYSKYIEREKLTGNGNRISTTDKEKINTFIYKNEIDD